MSADSQGNDLAAVGIPVTGLAAFAPLDVANVVAKAALGAAPLVLPTAFKKLGLYKEDGGPQDSRDSGDAIKFFQKGYQLSGEDERSVVIGLAEQNANVLSLIEGRTPDANGVIEVSSSLPDNQFILLVVTKYRNGREVRRIGAARVTSVEPDQQERGSVEGAAVTFTWTPHDIFNGAPFWQWGPAFPTSGSSKTGWNVSVTGSPTGGTYTISVNGTATAPIAFDANASAVASAINAISGTTGISGVTASGTSPIVVTFPQPATMTVTSSLTGGTNPAVTVG
ncbi:hypothetical protein NCPPB3778_12 [Rathayibacter phage NCPPB3778]|nr:hypothetical protein NCPPB3778_12 [Rathayibacter phage NCPPB3778]